MTDEPAAATEPVPWNVLWAYKEWLAEELRWLCLGMADHPGSAHLFDFEDMDRPERAKIIKAFFFHDEEMCRFFHHTPDGLTPSKRATTVLTTVGIRLDEILDFENWSGT